jgi:DNA (cytosine-5)-methyltransferase 1
LLAVDLFAGAGGSSTGAEAAGARVVLAANHWRAAVEVHRDNHPGAEHCDCSHEWRVGVKVTLSLTPDDVANVGQT